MLYTFCYSRAKNARGLRHDAKTKEPISGIDAVLDETPLEECHTGLKSALPQSGEIEEASRVVKVGVAGGD